MKTISWARTVLLLLGGCSLLLVFAGLADRYLPMPLLTQAEEIAWSTRVVDRQGKTLRVFTTPTGFWRLPADLDRLDPRFIAGLFAVEDQRFWTHPGVDPLAMARATGQYLLNGRVLSGASTLTMQLVRLLSPRPRTVYNKLVEMIQALRLEQRMTKRQILELYLSLAPYGGNIQGVEAASLLYFRDAPTRLVPSRMALLLALPQAPESRRPDRFPANATHSRNLLLARLEKKGVLTSEAAQLAATRPVPGRASAPFLAPQLTGSLHRALPDSQCITTTLDRELQTKLEAIAAQASFALDRQTTVAALVVENATHQVLAHLGSGDFRQCQLDLTRAVRSPGSALKPFIYAMALERNLLHPKTLIFDGHQRFDTYGPSNFDGTTHGWVSVRTALQRSLNLPAVQVLERLGPQRFVSRLQRAGVTLRYQGQAGLSLALGGAGCTLEELVGLYTALARAGMYADLKTQPQQEAVETRLLSRRSVLLLDDCLLQLHTAPLAGAPGRVIRYKTGTSYGFRDAWAVGYDHGHTIGIWVGRPDGGYGKQLTGASAAVPLLKQVVAALPAVETKASAAGEAPADLEALPSGLRWFTDNTPELPAAPRIHYPVDGSRVILKRCGDSLEAIPLRAQGGVMPYHWLVNGSPVPLPANGEVASFTPQGPGGVQITLIDARGRHDRVAAWLESVP
ncbi:MAG: penicillin-binding protein 1C [Desulfobulbus propionicus]|nr:MAG: penicillin-binding protein 1C [Desulfobulbus propionicus]